MESIETPDISLKYYAELLEADPVNAVCGPARPNVRRVLMLFFLFQGNMEAPHTDEQASSTRSFTNSRNTSTRSIPTSKADSS